LAITSTANLGETTYSGRDLDAVLKYFLGSPEEYSRTGQVPVQLFGLLIQSPRPHRLGESVRPSRSFRCTVKVGRRHSADVFLHPDNYLHRGDADLTEPVPLGSYRALALIWARRSAGRMNKVKD